MQSTEQSTTADPRIVAWAPKQFALRVDDAMDIYVRAMNYPPHAGSQRAVTARRHATHDGFACQAALLDDGALVGFGYGYTTVPGQWWHDLVRKALTRDQAAQWLDNAFELSELHVLPEYQGARDGTPVADRTRRDRSGTTRSCCRRRTSTRGRSGSTGTSASSIYAGITCSPAMSGRSPCSAPACRCGPMALDAPAQTALRTVPALLGGALLAQIAYPLVSGDARDALTELIVVIVAAASLCHAAITRGPHAAAALAGVSVVGGFAVEVLGVHTGVPFGRYEYGDSLGASLFGVPVVIAFAWPMLAWPAALAARRLVHSFAARVAVGAWALTAWDVFLDPQMVAAGHWRWLDASAHLPGVPGVPLSDYAGWFVVSALMSLALQRIPHLERGSRPLAARVLPLDVGVVDARARRVPRPGRCGRLGLRRDGVGCAAARAVTGEAALKVATLGSALALAATVHTAINTRLLRRVPAGRPASSVSVLIPARDEAATIGACLDSPRSGPRGARARRRILR